MIVAYLGGKGRGKTLTMTKDAYDYYLMGYRVMTNMDNINFPAQIITNEQIKQINKDSNIVNCVLMIDEAQVFFDSRMSQTSGNKNFSYFIQQSRKRNIHIFYTAQFVNDVEKRLREQTDIKATPKIDEDTSVVEVTYTDLTTSEEDIDGTIRPPERVTLVFDAEPVFNLYQHEEMQV